MGNRLGGDLLARIGSIGYTGVQTVTADRLIIDGLDSWGLAKPGGVSIGPNVVDAETSGRAHSNAEMHRQIVSVKDKIVVKYRNLSPDEAPGVIQSVYKEFVPVSYISPRYGPRENVLFYVQANAPTLTLPMWIKGKWVPWSWEGLELTLTEK